MAAKAHKLLSPTDIELAATIIKDGIEAAGVGVVDLERRERGTVVMIRQPGSYFFDKLAISAYGITPVETSQTAPSKPLAIAIKRWVGRAKKVQGTL